MTDEERIERLEQAVATLYHVCVELGEYCKEVERRNGYGKADNKWIWEDVAEETSNDN